MQNYNPCNFLVEQDEINYIVGQGVMIGTNNNIRYIHTGLPDLPLIGGNPL